MKKRVSQCGRPSGRRKTAKIEVVLEPSVKVEFMRILTSEGKTASAEIGCWIIKYIKTAKAEAGSNQG